MTTLYDAETMATDPILIRRVRAAVVIAAVDVAAEATTTTNHTNRAILSWNILNGDDDTYAKRFAWAMTSNPTIFAEFNFNQSNIPDADIQFAVNSLFDAVAKTGS